MNKAPYTLKRTLPRPRVRVTPSLLQETRDLTNCGSQHVALIILVGQLLVPGGILAQPSTPIHPAWILQDRLSTRVVQAVHRRWPFTPGGGGSPRLQKRKGKRRRRTRTAQQSGRFRDSTGTTAQVEDAGKGPPEVHRQAARVQPPTAWPTHLLDLMDADACRHPRRGIRRMRWEQGLAYGVPALRWVAG